jgi:putative aldouronate transport system permease protein
MKEKKILTSIVLKRDLKMNWSIYLVFLPIAVYFVIFSYLPMFGIVMAFEDFTPVKGFFGSPWVGFDNFRQFFSNPDFLRVLRNTVVISLMGLLINFPLTIIFALLLNELFFVRFKKTVQTISYLPFFVSATVVCGMIIDFVSSNGIITNIFVNLGMPRVNMLTDPKYFWWIYTFSGVWQGLGYGSIIFVAVLGDVSPELHEAAAIDGANRLSRVWHVTLPSITPMIVTMFILQMAQILSVGSDKILLLYNPSIYETADVISTHVYRMGLERMQYSYSSVVGLFQSLVGIVMLLSANTLSRKVVGSSIF